jgi:hypothetical protein
MIGVACVVAVLGGALAQEQAAAPVRPAIRYDRMPDRGDFERNYPSRARSENIAGVGVLCCTIQPDRTLACEVAREWPEGRGFGAASLVVVRGFRVFEESYLQAQAAGDLSVRRNILWAFPDISDAQMQQLRAVSARVAEGACPIAASSPINP